MLHPAAPACGETEAQRGKGPVLAWVPPPPPPAPRCGEGGVLLRQSTGYLSGPPKPHPPQRRPLSLPVALDFRPPVWAAPLCLRRYRAPLGSGKTRRSPGRPWEGRRAPTATGNGGKTGAERGSRWGRTRGWRVGTATSSSKGAPTGKCEVRGRPRRRYPQGRDSSQRPHCQGRALEGRPRTLSGGNGQPAGESGSRPRSKAGFREGARPPGCGAGWEGQPRGGGANPPVAPPPRPGLRPLPQAARDLLGADRLIKCRVFPRGPRPQQPPPEPAPAGGASIIPEPGAAPASSGGGAAPDTDLGAAGRGARRDRRGERGLRRRPPRWETRGALESLSA